MEVEYFFDTYALVEIVKGNASYGYFVGKKITLSIFNLAEIYWSVLNSYDEGNADAVFLAFRSGVVDIEDDTIKEAMRFRKLQKRRDLSYADCVGYIHARRNGMKFLTGDKAFADFPNVEYIK